jgi:hypothetical protein
MQFESGWFDLPFFSEREEPPVTLQIGMIGSDGFAIVGDTWKHVPAQQRAWFGYSGPKMFVSASGKSLAAIARSIDASSQVVREVFQRLEGKSGDKTEAIAEIGTRVAQDLDVELFVVFTDPSPEMYFFQKEKAGQAKCELMYGCYPIGDAGNTAYYWIMRNYDAGLTVNQLVKIGALTVITGAKVNPAMIQDLEVATFDKKGLRIWERGESAALKAEAEDIDKRIGALLPRAGVT